MSTPRRFSDREDDSPCSQHHGVVRIIFNSKSERIIERGRCTRHEDRGSTVFNGVDSKTGSLVTLREWFFRWRCMGEGDEDSEGNKLKKQLQSIESEMKTLLHLRSPKLVPYLGMNCFHELQQVTIHVLSDFTGECSLEGMYLQQGKPVPLPLLRNYTQDLVSALDYLHHNDTVHKDLRAASVFIDGNGQARLADFSVVKRLYDLYQSVDKGKLQVHFPDFQPTVYSRASKRGDVYLLGMLLLSLAQGTEITDSYPKIPDSMHQPFQDFLAKCLVELDRDRPSPHQLLEHRFLKEPISLSIGDVFSQEESAKSQAKSSGQSRQEEEEDKDEVPLLTMLELCGKSRITQEFEILRSLGKGGYGDVIKVKNSLDGKCYAIKRVRLAPKSKNFNKKILREVQLLSSLNHENVVRYYNSWIEVSQETSGASDTSTLSSRTPDNKESAPKTSPASLGNGLHVNSLGLADDIEKFAPQLTETSPSWSTSLSFGQMAGQESDDDDSDDESDIFGVSSFRLDSSASVVFGSNSDASSVKEDSPHEDQKKQVTTYAGKKPAEAEQEVVPETEEQNFVQFLYIQMEYCEKSTLRNCIDDNLFIKPNRKWRLFREIVEGLTHIHCKNLIHRDLKPVNIFLDYDDHVKIGDFGLATARMDHKGPIDPAALVPSEIADLLQSPSADSNLTGRVGTALYVSPEMMSDTKVIYDQKVDIYSLGIIFFEMSYKPLSTGMERVKILGNLRQNPAVFPEDFDDQRDHREARILRWLLDHNPHDRPTAQQLLHCDALPPPQMEETKMNEIIRATFSTKRTKLYHRMVEAMFGQKVDKTTELVYELDINKDLSVGTLLMQHMVREELEWLFGQHGAVPVSLPLLLPKVDLRRATPQSADFMDTSGTIVCLPYELRVSFARYIAKHNIQRLKRYTIDRVFRTAKRSGHHPKEIVECAYDIITPHSTTQDKSKYFPDVEVLCLAQEVVKKFPPLKARNYYIKINHMALLRGILLHCGVPEAKMDTVLYQLDVQPDLWQKPRELMKKCELALSDQNFGPMNNLLGREDSFREISAAMKIITRTKTQASMMVKSGLQELVDILDLAKCYGLRLEVKVAPGLIFHPCQYSGMVFQVVYNRMRKNNIIPEPLAAGGRYDELVKYFFSHFIGPLGAARGMSSQLGVPALPPQAVGISFAYNNITAAFSATKDQQEQLERPTQYDVLVCTQTNKVAASERLVVLGKLIPEGIRAEIKAEPLEDSDSLVAECKMSGCSQVVILQDPDYNQGLVTVRSLEVDGQTVTATKKVSLSSLPSYLKQKISQTFKVENTEDRPSSGKVGHMEGGGMPGAYGSSSATISLNFTFIETKMAYNTRKRMEALIHGKVNAAYPWVPVRILEVISGDFDLNCLQMLSAFLALDGDESAFETSVETVLERVTQQKTKKILSQVTDKICELRFEKKCQFIVLYSQKADSLKLLY